MTTVTNEKAQDAANVMGQGSHTNELQNSTKPAEINGYVVDAPSAQR